MGKVLTVVISYFNQSAVLRRHIETWQSYSDEIKNKISFILVDDCSEISATEALRSIDISSLDLELYRVLDDLYCNIAGVRNLGAQQCKTEWMLILDMDTFVTKELMHGILELAEKNESHTAYKFNRVVPEDPIHIKNQVIHPAVCLLKTADYWRIGGCEEDLVGNYGYTDPCFFFRARGIVDVKVQENMYLTFDTAGESELIRDKSLNKKKYLKYKKRGGWSNKFLNFSWGKVHVIN